MSNQIAEIQRFIELSTAPTGAPVLSLYLPMDETPTLHHGYVALAMDLLKSAREGLTDEEARQLEVESEAVLGYIRQELRPVGRTLALFSSTPRHLLEVFHLQVRLPALARFADRPYCVPLQAALEDRPRIGVVVVDERQARLLTTVLGESEREQHVTSDVPGRQRQGGWAAFKFESDRAEHVDEHFRSVAAFLLEEHRRVRFSRLVLGASPETGARFTALLPAELSSIVAGRFAAEMFASESEVIDRAMVLADAAERQDEADLVKRILDTALSRGPASLGWDETLQLLADGRVHRLALAESHLGAEAADRALKLAWQTDAEVEFLHTEAADLLADHHGIGALLRY
jgi:peptide subunit release factor 1 (eRF1)